MGKKGKKSKAKQRSGTNAASSNSFAVPPRSTEEILGKIGPSSKATKKVVAELLHAVKYEKESASHLEVVARVGDAQEDEQPPPWTYETPAMKESSSARGTRLLCGRDAPFRLLGLDLPACDDAVVLSDPGMGEQDSKVQWKGGEGLALKFQRDDLSGKFMFVFLGECKLVDKDLWDFGVQFREGSGRFPWPGYFSVLQCPFCANLAIPALDTMPGSQSNTVDDDKTFIMVSHTISQFNNGALANRDIPRLCCKECFLRNLQTYDGDDNVYPTILRKSIPALHFGETHPKALQTFESAYSLTTLYECSGIHDSFSRTLTSAFTEAASGDGNLKARISASKTKENRGQRVVVMKSVDRPMCVACGVSSKNLQYCRRCKEEAGVLVHFCGAACQRRAWKSHKKICGAKSKNGDAKDRSANPKPSLSASKDKAEAKHNTAGDEAVPRCKRCKANPVDEACPAMCICCGTFIVCGPCSCKPDMGGAKNGRPPVPFFVCAECSSSRSKEEFDKVLPGQMLRRLLDKRPEGSHVRYTRLMLAQCMLNDYRSTTGIRQDVEAAKTEYLWLANDEDYALAQVAVGSCFDPLCRSSGEIWDGPINFGEIAVDFGLPKSPFSPNKQKALEYYSRAVEHDQTIALQIVGTMYKNGDLFPVDKAKAYQMLERAATRGDARAMANLGQMKMRGDGVPSDMTGGIDLYRQAADLGIYGAMFIIAQVGIQNPYLRDEGKKMVAKLIEEEWMPPNAEHYETWEKVCKMYSRW